jgi:hypothetical protein
MEFLDSKVEAVEGDIVGIFTNLIMYRLILISYSMQKNYKRSKILSIL